MTQRFFVDQNGNYLGSFDGPDEAMPEMLQGGVTVSSSPSDASQKWDFQSGSYDPPKTVIPDSVTSRQFKMQLVISGLKGPVETWVSAQPELVQVAYEYSSNFVRTEPMMQAGFTAMGFTEQQRNEFFTAASKL